MNGMIFQRLRENLVQRRNEISTWFRQAPSELRQTRLGPAADMAVEDQIRTLDDAIVRTENETIGVCEICHEHVEESALEMDYACCVCLEHLSGDEKSRLENDLQLSQKVQQALLPNTVPVIAGLDISAYSQPALIVGGDYFDFFRFRDGSPGFVIADVMGKGMAASLLMASFQASLRIITPESGEPHEVMARLNKIFRHNIRLTKFVTVFLARYDENTRILHYSNAGHNPPILVRKNGTMERLDPTGAAIGLIEDTSFETVMVPLLSGDRLLAFTDGVVELPNGQKEMFGDTRLEAFVRDSMNLDSRQTLNALRARLQEFSGSRVPADDTTIVSIAVREMN